MIIGYADVSVCSSRAKANKKSAANLLDLKKAIFSCSVEEDIAAGLYGGVGLSLDMLWIGAVVGTPQEGGSGS